MSLNKESGKGTLSSKYPNGYLDWEAPGQDRAAPRLKRCYQNIDVDINQNVNNENYALPEIQTKKNIPSIIRMCKLVMKRAWKLILNRNFIDECFQFSVTLGSCPAIIEMAGQIHKIIYLQTIIDVI